MPLQEATRKDLATMCKKFNLSGYGRLRKNALIEHITVGMTMRASEERTQRHASEIRQAMGGNNLAIPADLGRLLDSMTNTTPGRQGYGVFMSSNGMEVTDLTTRMTTSISIADVLNALQAAGRI